MGETVTFWVLAVVSVSAALGLIFARKAVYSALMLGVVMISLAVLYAVQDAPFLAAVQIIVYTGAVMMLFLFVLMLVGVDSSDSLVETLRGQRFWALVAGVGFASLLCLAIGNIVIGPAVGMGAVQEVGNVPSIAELIFTRHVFAFEVTSALLITAALGAMVLAHRERAEPKPTQRDLSKARFKEYAASGANPAPLPGPGTYARHNAIDMPALLPDGSISQLSINRYIARHEERQGTVSTAVSTNVPTVLDDGPDAPATVLDDRPSAPSASVVPPTPDVSDAPDAPATATVERPVVKETGPESVEEDAK